ncbi:hypothetical protein AB8A21_39830, partial [Streptomyces sp. BF23-18]|uniref:hypothetical protein n=1 Tax=Streptomyces sp. BF23-18 TaxID=3240282 RepID=UPI0034E41103
MLALAPLASGCAGTGSAPAPGTGPAAPAHAPRAVLRAGPARALAARHRLTRLRLPEEAVRVESVAHRTR